MTLMLKGGYATEDPRLDRVPTGHTKHLDKYPLTAATVPAAVGSMVIGVNWYANFDDPQPLSLGKGRGGYHSIGEGDLGRIRGGHATCLRNYGVRDSEAWWQYYNQGVEGRCVEFAGLRLLSHLNRERYDITSRWHYFNAQQLDYWPGGSYPGATPHYEGTSVDAMMQVFTKYGAIKAKRSGRQVSPYEAVRLVQPEKGLAAYRWATSWAQVREVLNVPSWMPGVPMLNSWGKKYPHQVILMDAAGERLLKEDGEFAVVTDR